MLSSCAATEKETKAPATFEIYGTMHPGTYEITEKGITLYHALHELSGPAMCETCFNLGGEERLWKLTAKKISVKRNGKVIEIQMDKANEVEIEENDVIYVPHIPL